MKIVCGIMTGTSLDSIDIAICKFYKETSSYRFELLLEGDFPLSDEYRKEILEIISNKNDISRISKMNFLIPELYLEAIENVCDENDFDFSRIDLIGMHGQTIWHQPKGENYLGSEIRSTLQIGSGSALAALTGKQVVWDFRSADLALGGQGAPLVPIFDKHFLSDPNKNRVALNIGGISNITCLPKDYLEHNIKAFDTGPGNMLMDLVSKKFFNIDYDKNGDIAKTGKINNDLLEKLLDTEFILQAPPKSSGRELFSAKYLSEKLNGFEIPKEDILTTLTEFTIDSITLNIDEFCPGTEEIIVSGGGARNKYLMGRLQLKNSDRNIISSTEIGINSDAKEAICFAFLAWLKVNNIPGNVPAVTGAKKEVVLGTVAG